MNDLYRYRPLTDDNSKLWNKLRVDGDVMPLVIDYEAADRPMRTFIAMIRTPAVVHPDFYRDMVKSAIWSIIDTALGIVVDDD